MIHPEEGGHSQPCHLWRHVQNSFSCPLLQHKAHRQWHLHILIKQYLSVWGFQNKIVSVYMVRAMPVGATVVSFNRRWWYHLLVASASQCFLPIPAFPHSPPRILMSGLSEIEKKKKKFANPSTHFLRDHDNGAL